MFWHIIKRIVGARYTVYDRLALVSAAVLLAIMLLTVADVTGRYVLNRPIRGAIEISMQMMSYVVFLCLAYTLVKGAHVRISLALDSLPQRLRIQAEVIAGLCLCGLLVWGSWAQFRDSWVVWELMPAAIDIPWWPAKLAMPIGFFAMAFQFSAYLLSHLIELARLPRG